MKTNLEIYYFDVNASTEIQIDKKWGYELFLETPKDGISAKFRIGVCLLKEIGDKHNKQEGAKLGKRLLKEEELEEDDNETFRYLKLAFKKGQAESLY